MKQLLLISNSTLYGGSYLDHAEEQIRHSLGTIRQVLFIPFALHDQDAYADHAATRYAAMGYSLQSIHRVSEPKQAIDSAEALFIGGGNTFRLLKHLYDSDLLDAIRRRVNQGMLYIGSSAGSNVAAPTIKTTNDMPIVAPPSFDALGLIDFQINPHYLDPDPTSKHMGETREERIRQFLEENETPVVGLREGTMLRVQDDEVLLLGNSSARIFRRSFEPVEIAPGSNLRELI
jgi:dipeptidase E